MKTSTFKKIHRDVLLEWIYDDNNSITEPFKILRNGRDLTNSYIGDNLSNNNIDNQLFPVDISKNKYAKIDTNRYNFLQVQDYSSQGPIRHDSIRIYFPSNFDFMEYQGIYLKVYTYDFLNKKLYDLSNFFFNKNDTSQSNLIGGIVPPLFYEDKLWDKTINLEVPSPASISFQRSSGIPVVGSINDLLTNGIGLSFTSPIFVDLQFITAVQTTGGLTTYLTNTKLTTQIPRSPELEELSLYVEESSQGDFFEIYPIYNNSFDNYVEFIEQSRLIGKAYYNEYLITIFEQNIKGKTTKFIIDDDFSEKVEWRPIIKYSSSTAIIDIEMRLIDDVDGTIVSRKALYGLKPDQISKYALNLKKINIRNAYKPKIYVKKDIELADIDAVTRRDQQETIVNVDVPTLIDLEDICCRSENDMNFKFEKSIENYHPIGEMRILINPFDNILKFSLARRNNILNSLEFMDLTNVQTLKISFRSDMHNYEFDLYVPDSNVAYGSCAFRVPQSSYSDIKKMFIEENGLFYITALNSSVRSILYSGLFLPSDSNEAISILSDTQLGVVDTQIIEDPDNLTSGIAIVTRRLVESANPKQVVESKVVGEKVEPNKYGIDPKLRK